MAFGVNSQLINTRMHYFEALQLFLRYKHMFIFKIVED